MLAEANHTAQREDPALVVKPLVDLYMHQNTLMWSRVRLLLGDSGVRACGKLCTSQCCCLT
jgi:hypothetical protein